MGRGFVWVLAVGALLAGSANGEPVRGTVAFVPRAAANVPVAYRLEAHRFDFELTPGRALPLSGVATHRLTFPSPLETPYPENNTVHAEYYRPNGDGPFPAVIVLEVLAGGDGLARSQAQLLAQNGVAGLFVRMAYYGPRRPAQDNVRLLSPNVPRSLAGFRQTVLDCRRAAAWLASRPEIDAKKLGILGTSLGSFLAALTAEMEPNLNKVAILFGGGGLVDGYYDHPRAEPFIKSFESIGGSRALAKAVLAPIDPITHAANLKDRDVLIVAAKRDDIVPPKMATQLWEAAGKPPIVWFDTTHYGAVLFAVPTAEAMLKHFRSWR